MQCPKCRQVLPEGAQFCIRCGTALQAVMSVPAPAPAKGSAKIKWIGVGVGVLILAAVAFFIGKQAGLFTQAAGKPPQGPSVLQAQANAPEGPSVLQTPGAPPQGPSVLQTPGEKGPETQAVPKEIPDWLEHLRRIEMKRRQMRNDFSPALDMLKTALSMKVELEEEQMQAKQQNLEQGYEKYAQNWYALLTEYRSVPPPDSCKVLANTYDVALQNYIQIMLQLQEALQKQDVSGLMKMRGTAQGSVDDQLIQSDVELGKVCRNFGISKYFSIQADTHLDSLFGLGF